VLLLAQIAESTGGSKARRTRRYRLDIDEGSVSTSLPSLDQPTQVVGEFVWSRHGWGVAVDKGDAGERAPCGPVWVAGFEQLDRQLNSELVVESLRVAVRRC